jgi:branched-chain amino acid:cation transporter, LIVCS family
MFFSWVAVIPFSIACCLAIYALTIKKAKVMDIVGWILTPFFLFAIGGIVLMGIYNHPGDLVPSALSISDSLVFGLNSGYNTMDLLGSFFFCSVVMQALRTISYTDGELDRKKLIKNGLISCVIGATLLAIVYIGMSYVASLHSTSLANVKADVLLGTLALHVLGPYAGIVTCLAVVLACLTTAIALAAVFSEFLQQDILQGRVSYHKSLVGTLIVAFFVSTLEFSGIVKFLFPIVQLLYPALLILCIVNIGYGLWGRQAKAKVPVA